MLIKIAEQLMVDRDFESVNALSMEIPQVPQTRDIRACRLHADFRSWISFAIEIVIKWSLVDGYPFLKMHR